MKEKFVHLDHKLIMSFQKVSDHLARVAMFVVYFWFGILKIFGSSPANPLVSHLLEKTLPFITFDQFILCFGLFEMLIGVVFLFPKHIRIAIPLLFVHMITTFLPLLLLPSVTWQGFLTPTLEGQYIIKNLVIIALAINLVAKTKSLKELRETRTS